MVSGMARFLGQLGRLLGGINGRDQSDAQLLEQFLQHHDQTAFAGLIERHGPMVWNVCRRVLAQESDAEDAFQATFLVLVRKAQSITRRESLASWLYGVAHRVACQTRAASQRRQTILHELQAMSSIEPSPEDHLPDVRALLDEELNQLPSKYRTPLILCYLQGKTNEQAAQELGWRTGSMSRRLDKARHLLRARLVRRGLALSTATWAVLLAEQACASALPAALVFKTSQAILTAGAGTGFSAAVLALAERMMRTMFLAKLRMIVTMTLVLTGLVAAGVVVRQEMLAQPPRQQDPSARSKPGEKGTPAATAELPVDRQGDPLPPGALARLGTLRLRHGGQVYAVAYSPDGSILASGARDSGIRLWDAATHKELRHLQGHQNGIMAIAFSRDGKRLASASEDRTIRLWDVTTGKCLGLFQGHEAAVMAVVMVPDGKTIISAGLDKAIRFWEVPDLQPGQGAMAGKEIRCLNDKLGYLYALALSPDAKTLAAGNGNGRIRLWDLTTSKESGELVGHKGEVYSLAFAGNDLLASSGNDCTARLWRLPTGKVEWQTRQGQCVHAVAVSRDRKLVAAAGHMGIVIYDQETRREWKDPLLKDDVPVQPGDKWGPSSWVRDGIKALAFSPDGQTLAAGGFDSRVHEWNLATGKERHFPQEHLGDVESLAFSPDGKLLATGSRDRTLRVWSVSTGMERWRATNFADSDAVVCSVAMSPDGRTLAAATHTGELHLWDVVAGQEKTRLGGRCCVFSRDGALLACGGQDGSISLSDGASGAFRFVLENKGLEIHHLALSPDGKHLVAGCQDAKNNDMRGVLRYWDLSQKKLEREVPVHRYGVTSVAFSPDGRFIASTGANETQVRVWDGALEDPRPVLVPLDLQHAYTAVFSPDGKVLAVGQGRVVVLWDLAKKQEIRRLEGHRREVRSLAFSADGRLLASGSDDSTVLIWDLTGRLAQEKLPLSLVRIELEQLCRDLSDPDEGRAASAQRTLAAGARDALPYLQARLQEWIGPDPRPVARWIADLDHDQFEVRERATAELERLGAAVVQDLKKAHTQTSSAEARHRLEQLLGRLRRGQENVPPPPPERVLAVLECIGTPDARRILANVAKGDSASAWTKAAHIVLKRLGD
jgi:RNA polymerase sigma factor (sigma-70 family)